MLRSLVCSSAGIGLVPCHLKCADQLSLIIGMRSAGAWLSRSEILPSSPAKRGLESASSRFGRSPVRMTVTARFSTLPSCTTVSILLYLLNSDCKIRYVACGSALMSMSRIEARRFRINVAAVLRDAIGERRQVERFQRAVGPQLQTVVADKELAGDREHVGLDTRETVVERVEERARVLVVVVGVGVR